MRFLFEIGLRIKFENVPFFDNEIFCSIKIDNSRQKYLFLQIYNISQILNDFLVLSIILVLTDIASNSESLE